MFKKKENVVLDNGETIESIGPWAIAWRKFKANKVAFSGLIVFVLVVLSVIFVPIIMGIDVNFLDQSMSNAGPSAQHLLGCDKQGRDVLFRLMYGGRISMLVGVISAVIVVILGCIIGGIAGYYGGFIDNALMRFSEIIYSLPFTPMIIAIGATMMWVDQDIKMYVVSLMIGLLSWPGLARLVRGQILTLREQEFMQACEALGFSDFSKIFRHLMPNVIYIVIVNATLQMAGAILTEAGLSFLGMGVQAPIPSWGNIMELARDSAIFMKYPLQWLPAGLMCLLTVVSINLVGDGLRDAFDPKELQ